jgi:hypothetical protein
MIPKTYDCSKCGKPVRLTDVIEALGIVWHSKCCPKNIRGARRLIEPHCVKCQNEPEHDGDHVLEGQK